MVELGNDAHGNPIRLSASFLGEWLMCRQRALYHYVHRLPTPTSIYMGNGIAAHEAVGALYQSRIDGAPMLWAAVDEVYNRAFRKGLSIWWIPQYADHENIRRGTLGALYPYYHEWASAIQPRAVEQWMETELLVGLPGGRKLRVPWVGKTDLIEKGNRVVDFKLVMKTPEWDKQPEGVEHQILGYSISVELLTGERPPEGRYDYLIVGRGTPQITPVPVVITDEKLQRFTSMACQAALELHQEVVNINPGHPYCKADGCPYWQRCHEDW